MFALVVVAMLTFVSASGVYAQGEGGDDKQKYDEITAEYDLKETSSIPQGVTPIQVNSPEELEALLQQFSANDSSPHIDIVEPAMRPSGDATTMSTTYGTVTRACTSNAGAATFNTEGDIRVDYSGSFRWIDSVLSTRTSLTGITYGLSMSEPYSYAYNQSSSSVSVKGGAIINAYILLDTGATTVYSTPVSCSFTYSVY